MVARKIDKRKERLRKMRLERIEQELGNRRQLTMVEMKSPAVKHGKNG